MSYTRTSDFLALLRETGNGVRFERTPGLDWLVAGMAAAQMFLLWVSATQAPLTHQTTTVWLKTAVPSYAAEGEVWLWDVSLGAFVPATPALWQALFSALGLEIPGFDTLVSQVATNTTHIAINTTHIVTNTDDIHILQTEVAELGGDYFATSETLTTGVDPVSIDPTVFLTKIISGGTAGTEVVNFDDYNVNQSGKPHLIVFETQTDPADVIAIEGSSDILISPFGPLANASAAVQWPAVFAMNTMLLNAPGDGFSLTWKGSNWSLTEQVGATPAITYDNAFKQGWDGINTGPSALTQLEDNTFALVPDATSPFLNHVVVASTDINNPTRISSAPRVSRVHSAGNGGPSYVTLLAPDTDTLDFTLVTKTLYLETKVNPADTVVMSLGGGANVVNLANPDGSRFTSAVLDTQDDQISMYWDNIWIVEPPTNATLAPGIIWPLYGSPLPYVLATSGGTRNVLKTENARSFMNTGGAESFQLPAATGSGRWHTFICNNAGGITVLLGVGDTANVNGSSTSSGGSASTTTVGRSLTLQDVATHLWMATSQLGAWTLA